MLRHHGNGAPLTNGHFNVDVAALASGGYALTWIGSDARSYGIAAQAFDATGVRVGAETLVNTQIQGDQFNPEITGLNGTAPFSADGQLRLAMIGGHTVLQGNTAGTLRADFAIVLDNNPVLTVNDLIL